MCLMKTRKTQLITYIWGSINSRVGGRTVAWRAGRCTGGGVEVDI